MPDRFIYFLQVVGNGPIKIGCAYKPTARLMQLRTWCPYPLELAATAPGSMAEEKALHLKFKPHRLQFEWYSPHGALTEMISLVKETGLLPNDICADGRPLVMASVDEVCAMFGGQARVAELLDIDISGISRWKERAVIPPRTLYRLWRIAGDEGIDIDRFPAIMRPAPQAAQ